MSTEFMHEHQYIIFELGVPSSEKRGPRIQPDSYHVSHFTGLAVGKPGLFSGDFTMADREYPSVVNLTDTMGEWVAVAEKNIETGREFIVFADAFGYCPVFYAHLPGNKFVISDTFHGVAAALEEAGQNRKLNLANYVSTLTSNMSYFQSIFSNETMSEEIRVLQPDEFIHIGADNGVSFHPRAILSATQQLHSYRDSLQAGLDLSRAVIEVLNSLDEVDRRLTLSGGVDSRTVLAQLIASGHPQHYSVFTVDPRTWTNKNTAQVIERDIEISNQLRSDFNMEWWAPGNRTKFETSFIESLSALQSYRSNMYYSARPSKSFTAHGKLTVTLRGGGGEIISATSGGRNLAERYRTSRSKLDPYEWAGKHYTNNPILLPEFKDLSQEYVKSTLRSFELESFEESLNNHYFQTRNRAHFGHLRHSLVSNELTMHMLSNPYLLHASRMVPFDMRSQGQVMRDIFKHTTPALLNYAFDSQEWTNILSNDSAKRPEQGSWIDSYDRAKATAEPIVDAKLQIPSLLPRDAHLHFDNIAENYLKYVLDVITELVPTDLKELLNKQHSAVMARASGGGPGLYNAVLKATSALDGFFPQSPLGAKIVRYCDNRSDRAQAHLQTENFSPPPLLIKKRLGFPIFEQKPILSHTKEGFQIDTRFKSDRESDYQFAYYLMRNGEKIEQIWYQKSSVVTFRGSFQPGTYQGIAHIRYNCGKTPVYYKKTNTIRL